MKVKMRIEEKKDDWGLVSERKIGMWIEILCGLILYKLVKFLFYDDDLLELDTSDASALFAVANRLEKLYGGKAYVGLKIPDSETGKPLSVDVVVVGKSEAVVVSVMNLSGFVSVNPDGTWLCDSTRLPDPVEHVAKQASVVESYLEQRGVALPPGFLSPKVVLPNPKCCTLQADSFPSQVITYDQWAHLKPESTASISGWFKTAFRPEKHEAQSLHQQLHFVLTTAPIWDRLEVKGNKYVLGEFLEFKGKQEDVHALRNVKRSKVSRMLIQKTSMLGLAHSKLQVLYSPRDYRSEAEWKEAVVRSSTEVLFQPTNSTKLRKFKLSSIVSMSLSA